MFIIKISYLLAEFLILFMKAFFPLQQERRTKSKPLILCFHEVNFVFKYDSDVLHFHLPLLQFIKLTWDKILKGI